jgi:hypothetical protein
MKECMLKQHIKLAWFFAKCKDPVIGLRSRKRVNRKNAYEETSRKTLAILIMQESEKSINVRERVRGKPPWRCGYD